MTLRLATLTTVRPALYFGLAIAGMAGPSLFVSHAPLIALTVIAARLGVASLFAEGRLGSGVREDRSNRRVIGTLGVLGFADAHLPAYSDRLDILTFDGEGVRWFVVRAFGGVLSPRRPSCSGADSAALSRFNRTIAS